MSTIRTNTLLAADGTQTTEPSIPALDQRMAKAWVNFNPRTTLSVRASYNVSSVVDNGVGDYAINFTTPFEDVDYIYHLDAQYRDANNDGNALVPRLHKWTTRPYTASTFPVFVGDWLVGGYAGTGYDGSYVTATFFR